LSDDLTGWKVTFTAKKLSLQGGSDALSAKRLYRQNS
jgi:hypothetical protein